MPKTEQHISVIIPCFNNHKTILGTIYSLEKQTKVPNEIIIVDDGSTPNISTIIEENKKIQIIRQKNKGAAAARNIGLSHATGEYVIFVDADVEFYPNAIEILYTTLQCNPTASYAYGNYILGNKKMQAQTFDPVALMKKNYISTMSLIRKKDVIPWDESLSRFQDWDLWLSLLEKKRHGVWVPEYLFTTQKSGISTWLPSFAYKKPWKYLPWWRIPVYKYEQAKKIIYKKHAQDYALKKEN